METANANGTVNVACGANLQSLPVVGQSIGAIKESLKDVLNIPADAQALVSGAKVKDAYVIQENDRVEFVKPSGTNG